MGVVGATDPRQVSTVPPQWAAGTAHHNSNYHRRTRMRAGMVLVLLWAGLACVAATCVDCTTFLGCLVTCRHSNARPVSRPYHQQTGYGSWVPFSSLVGRVRYRTAQP